MDGWTQVSVFMYPTLWLLDEIERKSRNYRVSKFLTSNRGVGLEGWKVVNPGMGCLQDTEVEGRGTTTRGMFDGIKIE